MDPSDIVRQNVGALRARIADAAARAGRDPAGVRLLPITKSVGPGAFAWLAAAGLREAGENRVQDAERKAGAALAAGVSLVLVGRLQRNKARRAARLFRAFYALDSIRLAEALAPALEEAGEDLPSFLEVNTSGEPAKGGVPPEALPALLGALRETRRIRAVGLMTMGPAAGPAEGARRCFRALRRLADGCAGRPPFPGRPLLSMGMSRDFEIAIEEGADVVRIGTALFAGVPAASAQQ